MNSRWILICLLHLLQDDASAYQGQAHCGGTYEMSGLYLGDTLRITSHGEYTGLDPAPTKSNCAITLRVRSSSIWYYGVLAVKTP